MNNKTARSSAIPTEKVKQRKFEACKNRVQCLRSVYELQEPLHTLTEYRKFCCSSGPTVTPAPARIFQKACAAHPTTSKVSLMAIDPLRKINSNRLPNYAAKISSADMTCQHRRFASPKTAGCGFVVQISLRRTGNWGCWAFINTNYQIARGYFAR